MPERSRWLEEGTLATVRNHIRITCPPGAIWDRIGDPCRIQEWFPGMSEVTVRDGRRFITNRIGQGIVEDIVTNDPVMRRFQYKLSQALVPVDHHLGTVDVIDLEDGTSLVVYSTEIVPAALAFALQGAIQAALAELKIQCEADASHHSRANGQNPTGVEREA